MKIGIVLHPYGAKNPSGLDRYTSDLAEAVIGAGNDHEFLVFTKGVHKEPPRFSGTHWRIVPLPTHRLWLETLRFAERADAYLFPTTVMPLFFAPPSVVIVHSFPYLRFPAEKFSQQFGNFFLKRLHSRALAAAAHIGADSEYAKRETIELFGIAAEKITVAYPSSRDICALSPMEVPLKKPYFLAVGSVKELKNALRIVEALGTAKRSGNIPHALVVAGTIGQSPYALRVREAIARLNLEEDVIFAGHMNDNQMSFLYRNATALVFPSIVESFGMTILEAMHCGVPVIASNRTGTAETAGNAGLLVDPTDISALANALYRVTTDEKLCTVLKEKGKRQIEKFSWRKTGALVLGLLEKATRNI